LVLATLERMRGEVSVLAGGTKRPAALLQGIQSGQGLEAMGPFSEAVMLYADTSRLQLGPDSKVVELSDRVAGGPEKRISFGRGTLAIDLVGQPEASSLLVETPLAEIRSAGAYLVLSVDAESTRIEVGSGRVRVARAADGRTLELGGGQFAQVGAAFEFAARPLLRPDKKKKGKKDLELETGSRARQPAFHPEEAQANIPRIRPTPIHICRRSSSGLERGGGSGD
jgi:ferric-dicitrate binding protein FerR (iron transport regulator)